MKTLFLSIVMSGLCHAQAVSGIHAPVSRNVNIPADEASFNVMVGGKLESTAQQVKAALQDAGAPNPTVVALSVGRSNEANSVAQVAYSATFTLPANSAAEVTKSLLNLSTHLPGTLTSLQLSVTYSASAEKVEAVRQSLLPQLREEAQKTAQSLAAAAGVKLGRLRAVNDNAAGGLYLVARNGDFSAIGGVLGVLPPIIPYTIRLELVFDTLL